MKYHIVDQFQDTAPKMYPEMVKNLNDETSIVKNITFVVTENCNLNCGYCYECSKTKRMMTKDVAKKAIDALFEKEKMNGYIDSNKHKFLIIEFFGGEPLLNIDIIDFISDYFVKKAFEMNHPWYKYHVFNMTTNGVLFLDEKVQKYFNKHKHNISFSITIDGKKELHDAYRVFHNGEGSHDIVEKSVKYAIEHFNLKSTKVTLAPSNIKYFSESMKYLFDLGLTDVSANCVFEDVWHDEDCKILYDQMIEFADYMLDNKLYYTHSCTMYEEDLGNPLDPSDNKNWCGGNGEMLSIGVDGKLYPCVRYMKYSLQNQPELCIGNITDGIKPKKYNPPLQLVDDITRKSQSTEECFNCKVAKGCAWCSGLNYDLFGTPNKRATFICKMHKTRVLANYYYWNKLYEIEGIDKEFKLYLTDDDIKLIRGDK